MRTVTACSWLLAAIILFGRSDCRRTTSEPSTTAYTEDVSTAEFMSPMSDDVSLSESTTPVHNTTLEVISGRKKPKDPENKSKVPRFPLFVYFLLPGIGIILCAGCAMRFKYRKKKPWSEAHHLQRQVAYLKQGNPVRRTNTNPNTSATDYRRFTNISTIEDKV